MKKTICCAVLLFSLSFLAADPMDLPASVQNGFKNAGLPLLREKQPVGDFTLKTLDGRDITLSQLRGKVVFLNFWATWCPPCREEMPSMEILYQRYKDRGLEFIAVDIQEKADQVREFLGAAYTFPVVLDGNGRVSNNYGVRSVPATIIIDRDGKAIVAAVGARNWNTPAVFSAFEGLLNNGQ